MLHVRVKGGQTLAAFVPYVIGMTHDYIPDQHFL